MTPTQFALTDALLVISSWRYALGIQHGYAPSTAAYDHQTRLENCGVALDSNEPLPADLRRRIEHIVKAYRAAVLPSAQHLHAIQSFVQIESSSRSLKLICPYLMLPDRLNLADYCAEDIIYLAHESHIDQQYVQHSDGFYLT
ncbi:hypothetical protein EKO04_008088 [Ascochyta lentis]|uniref:Uncharacterized protein n=1 Tax=Ascochyta lentis TaxID=205686 RepID=A0A8H7MI09_9PLEO|nr:hypothetical protein EKO04_008088 [Ascochyta lentis]